MEKVLCVKRKNLPDQWVKKKSVFRIKQELFYKTCSQFNFEFKERNSVEKNPDYKQIIPYIMILTKDLKNIAVYKRKGSEKRLHDLWSVGIGGHINPVDAEEDPNDPEKTIIAGMQRELDEELIKISSGDKPQFTGIINEETTDVGSVHIGIVFTMLTRHPDDYTGGEELAGFTWIQTIKARALNLELWSRLSLDLIG